MSNYSLHVEPDGEIQQLRKELMQQGAHHEEQLQLCYLDLAFYEAACDMEGRKLPDIAGLLMDGERWSTLLAEDHHGHLSVAVESFAQQQSKDVLERAKAQRRQSLDQVDTLSTIDQLLEAKEKAEQALSRAREGHADSARRATQLQGQEEEAKRQLETFKQETRVFFEQQQAAWAQEQASLLARLSEMESLQQQLEALKKDTSTQKRIDLARWVGKPQAEVMQRAIDLSEQVERLEADLAAKEEELDAFKMKTAEMWNLNHENVENQHLDQLAESRIKALETELEEAFCTIAELKEALSISQRDLQEQKERTQALEAELQQAKALDTELKAALALSQRELQEHKERAETELQQTNAADAMSLAALQRDLQEQKERAQALEAELQQVKALDAELKAALALSQRELQEHKERAETELQQTNDADAKSLAALQRDLEEQNERIHALEAELQQAKAAAVELKQRAVAAELETEVRCQQLEAELRAAQNAAAARTTLLIEMDQKLNADVIQLEDLVAAGVGRENEQAKTIARLQAALVTANQETDRAGDQVKALTTRVAELTLKLQNMQAKLDSSESTLPDEVTERGEPTLAALLATLLALCAVQDSHGMQLSAASQLCELCLEPANHAVVVSCVVTRANGSRF